MKQKISLALGIVVAGFVITGFQVHRFQSEQVVKMDQERKQLEGQLEQKRTELTRLKNFAQNIDKIKQELRELNVQLESALEHMPKNFNLSALLRRFSLVAQNTGIELSSFRPRAGEERKPNSFYSAITIDFEFGGTFMQTLAFLDQVSRLKRIVYVESLVMKSGNLEGGRGGDSIASTRVTVKTFRFVE